MNSRVPGLFFLLLCGAIGLVVFFTHRPAPEAAPAASESAVEFAARQLRASQRSAAAAEVQRIVAKEHPERAGEDSTELRQARAERLDAMAAAVRRALETTPTPEPSPWAENHAAP